MAFRKPGAKKLGGKFLSYGKKATAKTSFLLTFPKIAAIDAEAGMSFYEGKPRGKNLVIVSNTQSYQEFEEDLDDIAENFEEYDIKTFGLDSATKIKENLEENIMTIDEKREKMKGKSADETNLSIRSRGRIKYVNKRLQNLKIDLSTRGVNIVDIAQAKEIKEKQGDQFVTVGFEPDMQKGSDHDYDVVLYHYTEPDGKGGVRFLAEVQKDRLEVFKVGQVIENPSYDMWGTVLAETDSKEALNTSFVQQVEDGKRAYEEERNLEEANLADKFGALISSSTDEVKKEIAKEFKENKISGFDKLTTKQRDKALEIYKKYATA